MSQPQRRPASSSPRVEALEARWMPAIIGGYVHDDCNANGIFESSLVGTRPTSGTDEMGLGGSTLQLLDSTGQVIATTVSDPSGLYQFTQRDNVSTAPQELSFEVTFDEAKTNHDRMAALQQFDPTLGQLLSVEVIAEGTLYSQVQHENLESAAATVSTDLEATISYRLPGLAAVTGSATRTIEGTLAAFDGQADFQGTSAKDYGVAQVPATFTAAAVMDPAGMGEYIGTGTVAVAQSADVTSMTGGTGNLLGMVRSMAGGKVRVVYRYTPSNEIGAGQYTIVQNGGVPGYNDGLDTSDNVTAIPNSDRTDSIAVNIASQSDRSMTNHFGEMRQASLSGTVYHDLDVSGTYNAGDPPIAGATVQLNGSDAFGNVITRSTQTDPAGQYSFGALTRGTYTLTEIQPAGFEQGTNTVGTLGGTLSGDSVTVNVDCGDNGTSYNFGETTPPVAPPIVVPPPPIVTPPPAPILSKFFLIGSSWLTM